MDEVKYAARSRFERLATDATAWFETRTRDDGSRYDRLRDSGPPEWLTEAVREAHETPFGLMFPDDWRYGAIRASLDALAEGQDPDESSEFADGYVDTYTSDLVAWLASHDYRRAYVDQARDDGLVAGDADLDRRIAAGQFAEAADVFGRIVALLNEQLDDEDDDEDA